MELKERIAQIEQGLARLGLGEHICSIYSNRQEQLALIVPFVLIGLARHEKCLYIVDENTREGLTAAFKELGTDISGCEASGQFVFLTKENSYLKEGLFDPERMLQLLQEAQEEALRQGYNGLRVTGEMTWVFAGLPGSEKLAEYEAKLNRFFPQSKATAVCQYNEARFPAGILLDVIHTHPLVFLCGALCRNPYYVPAEIFLARLKKGMEEKVYAGVKEDIVKRARNEAEQEKKEEEIISISRFPAEDPHPVLRVSGRAEILYANPAARRILKEAGFADQELAKILPADLGRRIQEALETGETASGLEARVGERVYSYVLVPVAEAGYLNLYGTDITELKRAEELFEELFKNIHSGVAIYGAAAGGEDFVFKDFNKAAERIEGVRREDVVGRSVLEAFPGVKELGLFEVFQRVYRTGKPEHLPAGIYRDGRIEGWRENYVYKLPSGEIVAVYEDTTASKKAQQALEESRQRLEALIAFLPDATLAVNTKGEVIVWNRAMEELTGVKASEMLGKGNYEYAIPFYGERRPILLDLLFRPQKEIMEKYSFIKKEEGFFIAETFIPHLRGGKGAYMWSKACFLYDAGGKVAGAIEAIRDVTERRLTEEGLKEKVREAELLVKTAVEREMQMIRLKEKVSELEEKIRTQRPL